MASGTMVCRAQQPQADIYTNAMGIAPSRWIARQASHGAPSYMYVFSYVRDSDRATAVGAAHASEIPYVLDLLARPGAPAPGARCGRGWRCPSRHSPRCC